ncbi:DNA gyrase/topoisomerase IV subunit A [Ruminiclostridium cellulolyticum]|uniref:DNA gyrase/topoisomerase IV subunit A n=1 Tax=Ruminiclostridium cellulolyticum (strain ATCC 35319 / DSM 5812 / JCM 6584 / H10) TaxID=394503 RepID=B8I1F5_RUMCH|nr:DNA topoisomerase (ATP-hydrolyzing) subunit A [Ruminiclostridium cellulolyticum]ACL75753.1 DNA gyrase/topoisomerase IV subunit A [Ruminiclostridium cellulolyticum H10]
MTHKNLVEQNITETLESNYMPYAMSVIVSRAIPEIDGFKPSHRKLLYTMYKMSLLTGAKTKSSNIVGQTMKLNPHGDMAIYETMVRMTRGNNALLHPFVDSKGNFGKQYSRDMKFAAPRYTEAKLDKICEEIFKDIDKNTVEFVDNYDGTMKEPVLLPTTFPTILVNSNQGIAVGMASNICSFNLVEICKTTSALIDDENVVLEDYLKAPDFSSGGQLIYSAKEIRDIYKNGRGGFKVRARYKYDKENNCIEIIEIPYTTTVEAIIDQIIELIKGGKIREITDVRDETDLSGLKLTIDLRKNTDPDILMNKLFKLTPLQDSFSCNFNILINGRPRVMGVRTILNEWLNFRVECIKRQISYDIEKKSDKLHLLMGLKKILLDIDKAIQIIRGTEQEAKVVPNLMTGFGIDEIQADYIAEIKLRNLNKEYILNRVGETENLIKEIAELKDIHGNDNKVKKIIQKQLSEIAKKFGKPRRTEIISDEQVEEITTEHFIEDYNLKVFLTEHNYLKKIPLVSLRANPEHKLKDEDIIIQEIETHNKADLLMFTNKFNVYKSRIYEIPDCKASSLGEYLTNLLGLDNDEKIIYITATNNYEGYMLFFYENGKGAKIEMSGYATKTNRKKLANAYYSGSPLIRMIFITEDIELIAISSINKLLVFNTNSINPKTTKNSQGVQILTSKKGSLMTDIKTLDEMVLSNVDYYRTKNIPAVGYYIKEEDKTEKQMSLDLE